MTEFLQEGLQWLTQAHGRPYVVYEGPQSPRALLMIPAAIGMGLIVLHSLRARKGLATAVTFGFLLIVYFWKESDTINGVEYVVDQFPLQLFGVPAIIPVGWIYAAYVSLHLSRAILLNLNSRFRERLFPVLGLGMIIMSSFAVMLETTGSQVKWWNWDQVDWPKFYGMPYWIAFAWPNVFFMGMGTLVVMYYPNTFFPKTNPLANIATSIVYIAVVTTILSWYPPLAILVVVICFTVLKKWKLTQSPNGLHENFLRWDWRWRRELETSGEKE